MLVLRPSDLRLVPPAAVIRSLDDPACGCRRSRAPPPRARWSACLPSPPSCATEAAGGAARRAWPLPPPPPTSARCCATSARDDRPRARSSSPWTLYAAEVRPEIWARTEELHRRHRPRPGGASGGRRRRSRCRCATPRRGEAVGAISDQGIAVFLAGDHDALATAIGRYLVASGFLRDRADLRPEVGRRRRRPSGWTRTRSGPARRPASAPGPASFQSRETTHEDLEVETT